MTSNSLREGSLLSSKKRIMAIFAVALMLLSSIVIITEVSSSNGDSNAGEYITINTTNDGLSEETKTKLGGGDSTNYVLSTHTLTLDNINCSCTNVRGILLYPQYDTVTINLIGDNKIAVDYAGDDTAYPSYGLQSSNGGLIITGDVGSKLTVTVNDTGTVKESYGIVVFNGSLEIKNVTVNATAGAASGDGGISCGIRSATAPDAYGTYLVKMSNSTVTATGAAAASMSAGIIMGDPSDGSFIDNSTVTATGVWIESGLAFGLLAVDYSGSPGIQMKNGSKVIANGDTNGAAMASVSSLSPLSERAGFSTSLITGCDPFKGTTKLQPTESDWEPITGTTIDTKYVTVKNTSDPPVVTTHNVTYNINGGTGTAPTQEPVAEEATFTVAGIGDVTKTGYTFGGWTIDGDTSGKVYKAGDTVKMGTSDITFKAVWEESPGPGPTPTPSSDSNNGLVFVILVIVVILVIFALGWFSRND